MAARRVIALLCLALGAAGCGNAAEGKLSAAQGERLTGYVEQAQSAFDDQQCAQARAAAGEGARRVARFKGNLDDGLRQNLIDGFNHLESELAANCDKPEETPSPTPTVTATPSPEPTETPSPSPEPTETPSPEPTVTASPTPSATPNGTGGTQPGDQGAIPGDPTA